MAMLCYFFWAICACFAFLAALVEVSNRTREGLAIRYWVAGWMLLSGVGCTAAATEHWIRVGTPLPNLYGKNPLAVTQIANPKPAVVAAPTCTTRK